MFAQWANLNCNESFIKGYCAYFIKCISEGKISDKISLVCKSEKYYELENLTISFIRKKNRWCLLRPYDEWVFESGGKYFNLISSGGLLMLLETERELELKYKNLDILGIFYPFCDKILLGFEFQEIVRLFNWELSKDCVDDLFLHDIMVKEL